MRGGSIIPMQEPALTTHATRNNSFSLLVALDDQQNANGDLLWDDGESTNITQHVIITNHYQFCVEIFPGVVVYYYLLIYYLYNYNLTDLQL